MTDVMTTATAAERLGRALARSLPTYDGLPAGHRGRWRPRPAGSKLPWASHLEAYVWEGQGVAEVTDLFRRLGVALRTLGDERQGAAREIYAWGFPGRAFAPSKGDVDRVVDYAIALARGEVAALAPPVWNAYWTKVACAATIDLDLAPGMTPQAIMDSRVATALCLHLEAAGEPQDVALAASILKIPPARTGSGLLRQTFRSGRGQVWKACHAATSPARRWASQALGSQILVACARELNDTSVGERSDWTSFDVGAALFVEGY